MNVLEQSKIRIFIFEMIWSNWSKNGSIKRLFSKDRLKVYIEFDLILKRDTYKVIYSCLKVEKSEK